MTVTLYLICLPAAVSRRLAELRGQFTVTDVDGPYPCPSPDVRLYTVPGGQPASGFLGPRDRRVCYRVEVRP